MRLQFLNSPRVQGAFLAMALCMPLFFLAQDWWLNYWILKDGQTGTALVTGSYWGGHGNMKYLYTVNEKQYTGHSLPNWKDARYRSVLIGEHCPVYFSRSHPWLSVLYQPEVVFDALPFALIVLLLQSCAVITIINPKSRWAFRLGSQQSADCQGSHW